MHSFIEPDIFENNVPFDNTTPIYLIILLWKFGLDLELHYFCIFAENNENEHLIFRKVTSCKKPTQAMNNKIKLHILYYYVVDRLGAFFQKQWFIAVMSVLVW